MIPAFIQKSQVPHKPGVYIYKDKNSRVIYVGKAIDLYHRVASYFSGSHLPKTAAMVSEIASVETIIVESELEALILEANLIKKFLPIYNVRLVDDKDYLYIKVTKEDFPRVLTARKHELKGSLKYFGPFPSSRTVKETLKRLRRVFPWCSGRPLSGRACFYYHIGLCPGACVGKISKEEYRKNIFRLLQLLDGKKESLMENLSKEMDKASKAQDFEEAGRIKRILTGISYLTQPNRTSNYLENPNFLEDQRMLALKALQEALKLPKLPERIEGYDISNIQGKEATGSMVVLTNGEIDKSQYRKFKIHITGKPNDVGMHKEMMRRRLKNDWPLPDLIIIDGGRGQVNGVHQELITNNQSLPIYGLAKRMEWLYVPNSDQIVKLPKKSTALQLLQKLRDESHRFAITYHRKLRNKATFL
jgi:excinuclease ABC subunit C